MPALQPDPDAALHNAQPGKFKPAGADAPPPSAEPGTLSEGVERYPNPAPVQPTTTAPEHEQTWGDWLGSGWDSFGKSSSAAETLQLGDNSLGYESSLRKGYAPIVASLGLDATENPADFEDNGYANSLGAMISYGLRSRGDQELRLANLIKAARAKDPKALPGIPDDPTKLRAYVMAADKKDRDDARAQIASAGPGAGALAAQLYGGFKGSLADPGVIATMPIGGEGKTLLQVAGREALTNGMIAAVNLPAEVQARAARGEAPLTATEAAEQVGGAAVAGSVLGTAFHGVSSAISATGLPQKLAGVVGNIDLANTLSYKIYSNLPEPMQRKWGAGIVTKWAHRLADGEKLEDVFSNLSNVELATLSKAVIGEHAMTPEERAAAEHLTRTQEVGESSPFEEGPTGDGTHEDKLQSALTAIINNRPVEESPSVPRLGGSDVGDAAPAPGRPPAATSTAARRPLSPALAAAKLPADIYDGLVKRGLPDHLARGIAAGTFAEARGAFDAVNPTSGAFGVGQWLGPRKAELFRRYGPSPSLDQQLDFLVHELRGGDRGGASVLGAKDEVEALHRYIVDFMRPGAGGETTKDLGRGMAALGRAGEQLPDGAAIAGGAGGLDVPDDPNIAKLREEALQLDDQVIGSASRPDGSPVNLYTRRVSVDDLNVDAERFQFKGDGDQYGVTDRLRGVEQVDPLSLGRLTAWEAPDGKLFVADGHQRTGLLKRTGYSQPVDVAVLRSADGVTAEDAMVMAALKNLGEDSGTKLDAAKIGRANADALERAAKRLPKSSALIRDGKAIAKLSDEAFGAVINDVIPPDYAAVIGHLLPDRPEAHGAMVDLLNKLDPANRGQAESIVRQAIAAGMHTTEETDLFGGREVMQSLMLERAKVLEKGLAELRKSKLLFKTAAKEADRLEAVGSKIAKSASEKEAQANAQALELVSRLAFTHGPVADALNAAARKLAAGAKLADVAAEFANAVRSVDLGSLAGSVADADASRLVPDGAGRGGDAGEAGASVQEEQPSLTDLERATERFSDPEGKAAKQQAESLWHDFKAAIDDEALHSATDEDSYYSHLSDQEVAQELSDEAIGEAIDNQAIKRGRILTPPMSKGPHEPDSPEYEALLKELSDHALTADPSISADKMREQLVKRAEKAMEEGRFPLEDHGKPENIGPNPHAMEPSSVVLPPADPKKSADYAGPILSPEEAAAKLEGWKAEAKRIGEESPPPPGTVILSLFDASGRWSQPYRDMGYEVLQLDVKNGHDLLQNVGHYANAIDEFTAKGGKIAGVIAQPPCTTFAGSGARWWDERHNLNWANAVRRMWGEWAAKMFDSPVEYNQFLVAATESFIAAAKPEFFAMENPRGRIAKLNGLPKANLELEPNHFGDPYTKNTFLYGDFNNELPTAHVEPTEGSRAHKLRGNDEKEAGLRSLTPEGFAYAFALANHPGAGEHVGGRLPGEPGPAIPDRAPEGGQGGAADVAPAASRREQIKAATAALEGVKPGEFRTIEPFKAEEPGYHRFRYVGRDGTPVTGNYVVDGNTIEGFNIGDTHNPVQLGSAEIRNMFDQLRAEHPDVRYVQAYRKSGARTATGAGEQEIWLELGDRGIKFSREDPRPKSTEEPGNGAPARETDAGATKQPETGGGAENASNGLDRGPAKDPATADRERQQVELKAASPMQSLHEQLGTPGLGLFDHIDQPRFELDDEARALLEELDGDDKAVAALKGCL